MRIFSPRKIIFALIACILLFAALFWGLTEKSKPRFLAGVPFTEAYRNCIEEAKPKPEKGLCLRDLAEYVSGNSTASEIEAAIDSLTDSEDLAWCHEFLHYAGWGLYKKTKNLPDAFLGASGKCDSGMIHGIVEEYISEKLGGQDPEEFIMNVAPTACEEDTVKDNPLPSAHVLGYCYHGLGHAFMFITANDLPQSLRYCDMLPSSYSAGCYTGSFMENLQSKQVGRLGAHVSAYAPKEDNPDYPCSVLDEKHQDFCYRYAGIAVGVRTKGDFKQAFESCLKFSPAHRNICFWGVGSHIPAPQWSNRWAGEKCKIALEISVEAYEQCILGGMSFLIPLKLGNPQAIGEFCEAIEPGYRNLCFESAGENLRSWTTSKEEYAKKCGKLSSARGRALCLK